MAKKSLKDQFPQEWKGNQSGAHTAGTHVAKTQAEWEKLWAMTFSNYYPVPAAPKLPKGKMAVGVFTGQSSQPSDISIRLETEGDKTTVKWTAERRDSMLAVMNDPYLLAFVPATKDVAFVRDLSIKAPSKSAPKKGPGIG